MKQYLYLIGFCVVAGLVGPSVAFAQDGASANTYLPLGAALAMGLAAIGGTLGQARSISSGLDSIGRNPSAAGKITTPLYVGLAFVESLVIISFALAFLMQAKV